MLNGSSLAILTHTFVFKSTPGAGFGWVSLEPFGCYFGIQCSVKPITIKISDRVGCLCAILVLFARLFVWVCAEVLTNANFATQILLVVRTTLVTYHFKVSLGMEPCSISEWRFHKSWSVPYVWLNDAKKQKLVPG